MATKDLFRPVRYHTEATPYFWTEDNKPLQDLAVRTLILADKIDQVATSGGGSGGGGSTPVGGAFAVQTADSTGTDYFGSEFFTYNPTTETLHVPSLALNTYKLPFDDGGPGQAIITDGSGNLSWSNVATDTITNPSMGVKYSIQLSNGDTKFLADPNGASIHYDVNGISTMTLAGNVVISPIDSVSGTGSLTAKNGKFSTLILGNDHLYTLPLNDGASGQFLKTNGSGTLSWAAPFSSSLVNNGVIYSDSSGNLLSSGAFTFTTGGLGGSTLTVNGTVKVNGYNLPGADGAANQFVTTDGSGNLSWKSINVLPSGTAGLVQLSKGDGSFESDSTFSFDTVTHTLSTSHIESGSLKVGALNLPSIDGTSGQVIVTDGAGNASWSSVSAINGSSGSVNYVQISDGNGGFKPTSGRLSFNPSGVSSTKGLLSLSGNMNVDNISVIGDLTSTNGNFKTTNGSVESASGKFTSLQVSTYILPNSDGTSGQSLTTNGSGVLSWSSVSGGGASFGSDGIIQVSNGAGSFTGGGFLKVDSSTTPTLLHVGVNAEVQGDLAVDGTVTSLDISTMAVASESITIGPSNGTGIGKYKLPLVDGTISQVLSTDGAGVVSWRNETPTQAAGNTGEIQINDSDAFSSSSSFAFDTSTNTLNVPNTNTTITEPNQPNITSLGPLDSLTVIGDMNVGGTITSTSTTTLEITDPLVYIAEGNTANTVDIGVVGSFDNGTYQHTGFVRDATDGIWKLFENVIPEPTTVVDFSGATFSKLQVGELEASKLKITGAYTLPIIDGTVGQVLSTDGAGAVSWSTVSGTGGASSSGSSGALQFSDGVGGFDDISTAFLASSGDILHLGALQVDLSPLGSNGITINSTLSLAGPISTGASPSVGTAGQVLSSTGVSGLSPEWITLPTVAPGGSTGNFQVKSSTGTFEGISGMSYSGTTLSVGGIEVTTLKVSSGASTGHVLTSDSTGNATWSALPVDVTPAAGSTTQVQYNNSGAFAGDAGFTYSSGTGTVTATNFNNTSDVSLKTNIATLEGAPEIVRYLRGVSFDWKLSGKNSYGFIAQEVEEVLPFAVEENDEGIKSVNYSAIIPLLLETIKKQDERISILEKALLNGN